MDDRPRFLGYAWAAAAVVACTLAGLAMRPRFDLVNVAMVYLLGVVLIALRFTRGAAIAAAVLGVLAFDVLFVPPRGRLTVEDAQYLPSGAVSLRKFPAPISGPPRYLSSPGLRSGGWIWMWKWNPAYDAPSVGAWCSTITYGNDIRHRLS